MMYFDKDLLAILARRIKKDLNIDLDDNDTLVRSIPTGYKISGGYQREYPAHVYQVEGIDEGVPFVIRLYTTIGTITSINGFKIDATPSDTDTRSYYGYNLVLDGEDIRKYKTKSGFPTVTGVLSDEDCPANILYNPTQGLLTLGGNFLTLP